ncbi:hypothetical protein [Antarctobacter jejuensis]|uniref:hypothetical protein n=1 Tax=Antarctobacter jejuensis TaxID=1439938 RepID=UPI003FD0A5A0
MPGNHEENLAAHPQVDVSELHMAEGLNVPVWVDVDPAAPSSVTYVDILWEVEPTGEYLYHLAGNFPKNDKGLLRFASATLSAEVHVSFETDSIAVARQDEPHYAAQAQAAARDDQDISGMTVRDAEDLLTQGNGFALLRDAPGFSHIVGRAFTLPRDDVQRQSIVLTTCLITRIGQRDRMTKIKTASSDPDQPVAPMLTYHRGLIARFADIASHPLTGAIRM